MNEAALNFLKKHGMDPERVDPAVEAPKMAEDMARGLRGEKSSLPMIPTYLRLDGAISPGRTAAVIDAGGTNFRCALARFTETGCRVEEQHTWKMPGIGAPATWEAFISFAADGVEPLLDRTDCIGFCFSYSAAITPQIDGRVDRIDKEVVITGCEGQLVGASLAAELERRGIRGKRIVVLNDTAAVLLGGLAAGGTAGFGGYIGQVSGTGTNTCCVVPAGRIGKLGLEGDRGMIINTESGMYDGIPAGEFDLLLDKESKDPGSKRFEKQTAGVYLGELCRLMLRSAADEGLLSASGAEKTRALGRIDSAVIDGWAAGEGLERVCGSAEDAAFVKTLALALFERSARCMAANIAAILLLTGEGKERSVCVCAEGSLVEKSRCYRPMLERFLAEDVGGRLGLRAELRTVNEATLAGSAAAAVLNT